MAESGRGISKKRKKIHLLRHRKQQISAAHHLCDTHQRIVNDNGKLISPCPVGTAEDEIAAVAREVDSLPAVGSVSERYVTVGNKNTCGRLAAA